jgi:signal transduction histidine kinase
MTEREENTQAAEKEAMSLLRKAFKLRVNDPSESIKLTQLSLELAKTHEFNELIAKAKSQLGLLYMIQGDFENALVVSTEALVHFEREQDSKGIADAKYNIAGVHYKTDNYHLGLQYLLDCLRIYRQLDDVYNEARVLKSIGTVYEYFGDTENAIDTYLKCIDAGRLANDPNLESNAYNPLSGIYLKRGDIPLALATIEKSITIKDQTGDVRGMAFALYGRGKIRLKQQRYKDALHDLSEALRIHKDAGEKLGIAMCYNKLGLLFYESQNYEEAKKYLLLALSVADQYNIRFIRFKACHHLYKTFRANGEVEESLNYLEKYMAIKETVINQHTYNVIKSYETIFKVENLEREARAQRDRTDIIEKKNAELDSFFYRVSHDLKGPISSLLGLHNLIKLEVQDKHAQRYFDMYQTQITRINNIVMDLIHLTRMNHQEEHNVKIDFESILHDCIHAYHYMDNYNSIEFIMEIDPHIQFHSQWAIVNTILQNLIENAIKYARPNKNPYVRINIVQEENEIVIRVADNGIGIPVVYQPKVFNMFFRGDHPVQGTGLGLYILKRAVERLQGKVTFVSESNVGSTFTVNLPLLTSLR